MTNLSNGLCWSFLVVLTFNQCSTESNLKNTGLIDFKNYFNNVMQTFVNDLEDLPFCKLKMNDYSQDVNETLYGFDVKGKLMYTNGFLISIDNTYTTDSINDFISDKELTAIIRGELAFEHIQFAYDVEGQLESITEKATGIFAIKQLLMAVEIKKDLATNTTTSSLSKKATLAYVPMKRMAFVPKTDVTAVFARVFNTFTGVSETLESWVKKDFHRILEKVVTEKFSFPEIDYNTSA